MPCPGPIAWPRRSTWAATEAAEGGMPVEAALAELFDGSRFHLVGDLNTI